MKTPKRLLLLAGALCALLTAEGAHAAPNKVVIGDIDDMSGPYADILGAGGVEAIKMAIADFGGTVLGRGYVNDLFLTRIRDSHGFAAVARRRAK